MEMNQVDPNAQCICEIDGTQSQRTVQDCRENNGIVIAIIEGPGVPGGSLTDETPAANA